MISLPRFSAIISQYVEYLFLYLFQFIFHHHHYILHFCLIAFRASGIDFSSHLLGYETKFLSLRLAVGHGVVDTIGA